jgi:MSHA biogenesis protein MshE
VVLFHKRLGEILLERGQLTRRELDECLKEQEVTKEFLGIILLRKKFLDETKLTEILSSQFDMEFLLLKEQYIDWEKALKFSALFRAGHKLLPFFEDLASVKVAISDPLNVLLISEIEKMVQPKKLKLALVLPEELDEYLIEYHKLIKSSVKDVLKYE